MLKRRFRFRGEPLILDEEARRKAPGKFVELPDGMTHYEIAGPSDGQTIVLIHGLAIPGFLWDPTFDALVKTGFRVLRYDLYGRGYSDRPDKIYNQDLFQSQLLNLLSVLKVKRPMDLIGLSMGGPIAAVFADRHPDMVRKLCLIDPAGFSADFSIVSFLVARLLRVPMLGEWLMNLFGDKAFLSESPKDLYRPERFPDFMEKARSQLQYAGYKRALLSTLRYGPLGDMTETYARVAKQKRPILLIWGREDRTIPFSISGKARNVLPHSEFYAVDEAGHIPHYERPEMVNPFLIGFLEKR